MPKYLKQTCPSNYCNCSIIYIYREREGEGEKWCYKVLCIDSSRFRPVLSFDFIKLLCFQLGFLIMMFVVSVWYFNRKMRWDQRKNKTNTWFQDVSPHRKKSKRGMSVGSGSCSLNSPNEREIIQFRELR